MDSLKLRVELIQKEIGTYTLRLFHKYESCEFHGYTKEDIESLSANDIAAKFGSKEVFRNIIESDMGFYINDEWMTVTSLTLPKRYDENEMRIYPNDKCYICGMFSGWQGNPLKMYKGRPHCLICRMADENKANNVRP